MDVKTPFAPLELFLGKADLLLSSPETNVSPFSHDLSDLELVLCN